jgi:hypothetical protein
MQGMRRVRVLISVLLVIACAVAAMECERRREAAEAAGGRRGGV